MARSLQRLCRETLPLMLKETSGREMLGAVEEVQATDRWNSFDRFHDTTAALVRRYEAAGAGAEVEALPPQLQNVILDKKRAAEQQPSSSPFLLAKSPSFGFGRKRP